MTELLWIIPLLVLPIWWFFYIRRTGDAGAPFVPMELDALENMMNLADLKPGEIFYDLGSGDGRLVIWAAQKGAQAYGVEIDTSRVWYSRLWIWLLRLNSTAHIIQKNIFDVDLSDANVVSLYLLQTTNDKIKKKLEKKN